MSVDGGRFDVIVIGGGFAGVTAARDLGEQGHTVLLLEARDRLGGRTWSTTFPGTDMRIEMGGQFIVEGGLWPALAQEMERYGVEAQHLPAPESYPTILNGVRNPGPMPVPMEQLYDLERAVIYCQQAAARIQPGMPLDHQGLADLDIPLSQFLTPLNLPPETYEYVSAVIGQFVFRYNEESSALQALNALACFNLSAIQFANALDAYIPTGSLVERIAADVTKVRLGCPVVRVDQTGEDVLVRTAGGETVSASAVVVAVPLNVWNDIEFAPQLSEEKRVASGERHGAESLAKSLVRVRNAPKNPSVIAGPQSSGGVHSIFTIGEFENGDQLMGIFGYASLGGDHPHLDFDEPDSVARSLDTLLPGAELVDFFSHNYVTDPFSKGGPVSWRPGRISKSHSVLGAPEGRVAFTTADIAPKWLMFIEGAIESGHRAAWQTENHLLREREAASTRTYV